jgi:hypothetical protein
LGGGPSGGSGGGARFPVLGFRRPLEVARLEVAAEATHGGNLHGRRSAAYGSSSKLKPHGGGSSLGDKGSGGSGGNVSGDSGVGGGGGGSSGGAEGGGLSGGGDSKGGKQGGGLFGSGGGASGGSSSGGGGQSGAGGGGSSTSGSSSSGFNGAASGSGWYSEDLYCVAWHPDGSHLLCGGHDRRVQLIDLAASSSRSNVGGGHGNSVGSSGRRSSGSSSSSSAGLKIVKTLAGHAAAVVQVATNPAGNLLVSASRDGTVRFWDALSGLCVKRLGEQPSSGARVGEATSMALSADGTLVLTSTRHGAVKLWDLRRADKPLVRYKGHQNSASSFLRCGFGARESVVLSGSDDGTLHVWEAASGRPLSTLIGHPGGPSYRALWSAKQSLLASCGEDGTVRTWSYR